MHLSTSNKGWHSQWFYVKDDAAAPLLVFSGHVIQEAPRPWRWGVPIKEKNINDLLAALQFLKDRGMKGSGIIGAYHARRVAPLMARVLPLHQMAPRASFKGTVLVDEALPPSSRRRWSLRRTPPVSSLILCFRCRGIPQCGQNRGLLTS